LPRSAVEVRLYQAARGRLFHSTALPDAESPSQWLLRLVAIVLLQAGSQERGHFRFFRALPSEIAVTQWYVGLVKLNGIHGVADQYEHYLGALNVQQGRISQISLSLNHERNRRAEAFDHQYAYVGDEMPRVKPRSFMQLVNALGD